jgi:hypothetical protein
MPVHSTSRAANVVAAIVTVRTEQLELRLRAHRRGGALAGEALYRAGELDAALADLRAELGASEQQVGVGGRGLEAGRGIGRQAPGPGGG